MAAKKNKMKTKRAAAKRYIGLTASGKVKVGRKGKKHGFSNKNRKRKRQLKGTLLLGASDEKMAKSLLPYA
jgi:large subunit ribosomal protein L35